MMCVCAGHEVKLFIIVYAAMVINTASIKIKHDNNILLHITHNIYSTYCMKLKHRYADKL
jgi:hypothetical protein